MEIMFIKRNNNTYLILLSANDTGIALRPGTLSRPEIGLHIK